MHPEIPPLPGLLPAFSGAPGSDGERELRREHGWRGYVLRLRFNGVYLPEQLLSRRPIVHGLIVSHQVQQHWLVDLYDPEDAKTETLRDPVVRKRRPDSSMLVDGTEWDEGYLDRWPQTWLLGTSHAAVQRDLSAMATWLRSKYTGKLTIM